MEKRIEITGPAASTINLGRGLVERVGEYLGSGAQKVLIVHTASVAETASQLRELLLQQCSQVLLAEVPDAEGAKRVEVAAFCWQLMGQADFTRSDAVIGLGGGAVTDLAGFVAATWLRGVTLVQIPTSVLGMVDAAVGGKTGINTAEGKNLVGAFYAAQQVVCDLNLLRTLPRNEIISGFAEIAKCGFITREGILELIERDIETALNPESEAFAQLVQEAIEVKAEVVSEDFRESSKREILNYGHTLGHAIEHTERYQWRHGSAISIGMVYAAELSRLAGFLDDESVARHRRVLGALGLPLQYPRGRWESLLAVMQRDKKARAGMLRFIVLNSIGTPRVLAGVDESLLRFAYEEVAKDAHE